MNKNFDELYKYLLDQNMTDLSPEDFKSKYSTGKTFDELYSYMVANKKTDLSSLEFNKAYFGDGDYVTKKKKIPKDEPYDLYKKSITTLPKENVDENINQLVTKISSIKNLSKDGESELKKDFETGRRDVQEYISALEEEDEGILDNLAATHYLGPLGALYNAYDIAENFFKESDEEKIDRLSEKLDPVNLREQSIERHKIESAVNKGEFNLEKYKEYTGEKVTRSGKDKYSKSQFDERKSLSENIKVANSLGAEIETAGSLWWTSDLPEDLNSVPDWQIESAQEQLQEFLDFDETGIKLKQAWSANQSSILTDEQNKTFIVEAEGDADKALKIKEGYYNDESDEVAFEDIGQGVVDMILDARKGDQYAITAYRKWMKEEFGKETMQVFDYETGKYIREGLNREQIKESENKKQKVIDLSLQSKNFLVNSMQDAHSELLTAFKSMNKSDVKSSSSLFQALPEIFSPTREGSIRDDFALLEEGLTSGKINLSELTPLPSGTPGAADYNRALEKYRTLALANSLNYDPLTADVTIGGDIPIVGKMKYLQGIITGTPEALDIANLNDLEKAEYFAEVLQENAVELSSKDKEKIAIRNSMTFKTGNMIPGLTKMGLEIAATTYLTGGTGTHLAIAKNSARLIEAMLPGRALTPYIARWLSGTLNESIGLLGSNTIGGITTNSEPMPVLTFAAGASFGRTLYGGLARGAQNNFNRYTSSLLSKYKQGTATYSQETMLKAIGIVERGPTKTISTVGQSLLKPAISVGAIKIGEVSSGLVEQGLGAAGVIKPQLSFDEFWHHITDPHSFLELYGAMLTMGAAHPGALKGGVHKALDAVKTDIEIMSKGVEAQEMWNDMGRPFGLRRLSAIKQDSEIVAQGEFKDKKFKFFEKYQWTDKEIDNAVKKKIDQIDKTSDEKWDPFIQGRTKKEAKDIVTKQGKRLKLKRVVQEQWVDRFESLDLAQGEGSLYLRFENALKGIEKGESERVLIEEHDAITEAVSIVGESEVGEMLEASGLSKEDASKIIKAAQEFTINMDGARFHPKDPVTGKVNPLRTRATAQVFEILKIREIERELKSLKEDGSMNDAKFKIEKKELDEKLEATVIKLDEAVKEQNKLNEKEYQKQRKIIEKTQQDVNIIDADFKADPKKLILDIAKVVGSEQDALGFLETTKIELGDNSVEGIKDLMQQMFGLGEVLKVTENVAGFETFIPKNIKGEEVNKLIQVFDKGKLFAARDKATNLLEIYETTSGVLVHEPLHSILGSRISELGIRRRAEEIRKENPKLSLKKALKEAKKERDNFVEDFISVLKETKEYDIVLERVKNHPDYEKNKLTEEWFTIYGELTNEGKVGWKSGTKKFSKLIESFNEIVDAKDFFKSARDVRTFIQGFAKGRGLEANEIIQKATKDYIELNKKYGTEDVLKMSKNVGPELQELYEKNKADWDSERQDKGANKFINELAKPLINEKGNIEYGLLDGLIKAKIPWDKPPGFSEEDFMVSVYQELIPHIRNFNKNFREGKTDVENDSIFAWINTYLGRKIGNVFGKKNAATKDQFEISIDQEREGSAKFDIEAEASGDREIAQARITSQKTLKDAGLESISQEISSNLNDLNFKRLPKITSETSKNQTISPFLREFKKESGEKVQKVIMEAMGKKQKYIDYLSNNFGGVIENLPTGYLLKNFPFLMQKSVGGDRIEIEGGFREFKPKWTNNWQGKKIDYVGSERGMTSRPEYVRLNPEWKSELNKERFVETMTNFPGSKNISRDIAAKKKALAYQLGSEIALKKFEEQGKKYFEVQSEINNKKEDISDLKQKIAEIPDTRASERLAFGDKIAKIRDQIVDLEISRMDLDMFNSYTESTGYKPEGFEQKLNQQIIESTYRKSSTIAKKFNNDQKIEFWLNLENLTSEIQTLASKNKGKVEKQVVKDALRIVYGNFEWSDKGRIKRGGSWNEYYSNIKETDWDSIAREITTTVSEIKNSPRFKESELTDLITIDEIITKLKRQGQEVSKEQLKIGNKKIVELFRNPEVREKVIETTKDVYKSVVEAVEVYGKDGKLLTKETDIAKARKLINLALFNSQFTSMSSPERGGIFGNIESFMKKVILPAAKYNDLIIERTSKPKSIKVYKANNNGSKGELLATEKRLSNFNPKSSAFIKDEFINKDGSFDFENEKFLKDLEAINKDADTAWDLLNELYEHSSNMYKDGRIDNDTLFVLTKATQNTMNGLVRASAKLQGIYLPLKGESYPVKNQGNELEWEHQKAAETVTNELIRIYLNKNFRDESQGGKLNKQGLKALEELRDGFVVNIIPDAMNKFLNKVGLQIFRTKEGYYVLNTLGGSSMRAIFNLKTGKVEGEKHAKAAEIAKGSEDVRENNYKTLESTGVTPSSIKMSSNKKMIETARTIDKAIEKAREKEAPVKKIRVFDFDDTLAQTKSRVYYNKPNTSGKPATRFKAVMLAGAPGSGKSSIVKGLGLEKQGYKIVNQDISLEWAKNLVGLPRAEGEYDAVQRSKRSELGALARKIAERKLDKFTEAGTGIIVDGTGASLKATKAKMQALKSKGYDVKMVFVSTSKETSISRNQARKERSLKDFIVEKSWDNVNKNKAEYIKQFGQDFFEVNTDKLREGEIPADFKKMVNMNLNAVEKGRLNAGEFASKGKELVDQGFVMDFSDFNIVKEGQRGPLFNVAEKIRDARGTDDVFVLTARSQESAEAIQAFLKSEGLDLPIENIKGLGDSTGEAKAQWLVEKASEGYNDFYFADDHVANVEAVRGALNKLPVKSKVQQAKPKTKFSFDTKRNLEWKPMGPSQEVDGQKVQVIESTEWDIKGKKYGMYIERLYGEMLEQEISFLADKDLIGEKQGVDIQKLQEYIFNEGMEDINYNVGMDMGFFKLEKSKKRGREFDQVSKITETGDSQAIFSVVINGLKEKIRKDKKAEINYQFISYAAKVEGGRPSLYRLFAREFGRQLGFKVIEEPMYRIEYTVDPMDPFDTPAPVKMIEEGPIAYKFYLIKESLFEEADALIEPVKTKFSLNTKQELKWKKHDNKKVYPNTSETEFVVNNKDYLMDVEAKGVGSIFQKFEDPEYVAQLEQAGYDIEAIEDRLRDMELGKGPKPKTFNTNFYKIDNIVGLEPGKWYGPDGPNQNIGLREHIQADADGIIKIRDVDITGSGDAAEVLSVVVNGLVDKYKSTKGVVGLQFTSYEANRTSLYRRVANLFAEELNLEVLQSTPTEAYGTDFFLVNKDLLGERKELTELDAKPEVKFSLNTSKKLKWESRDEESDFALFKDSGEDYFIAVEKDIFSNTAVFEFGTYDKDLELDYELTNIGNSREVFGTVINGMIDYIKKNNIDTVRFNSQGYKRTRLYTSMARVFAKQLGWNWKAYFPFKGLATGKSYAEFEMSEYSLPIEKAEEIGNWNEKDFKTKFSLNTKKDLKWVTDTEKRTDYSAFKVKDKAYIIKVGRAGEVTFGLLDKKVSSMSIDKILEYSRLYPYAGGLDLGMTKTGDAAEIISIVSNGLLEYVKKNDTKQLRFTSEGTGRTRVYKRLIQYFAGIADMNYTWDVVNMFDFDGIIQHGKFEVSKNKLPQPKEEPPMSVEEYKADTQQRIREALGRNAGEPVEEALDVVDRNRPQQVTNRTKFSSTNMSRKFNMILEESTGVEHYKVFSEAKGRVVGASAKRQRFFIPPSAEDFQGLLYPTLGKGLIGEKHQKFYEQALFKPYNRGVSDLASDRAALMTDFKALKKTLKVPKNLRNKTKSGFTNEQAVRVWLWNKTEQEVPGISKGDLSQLLQIVDSDNTLRLFSEEILALTKNDGYSTPKQHWLTGTITTDLIDLLNTTKRAKYLKQWQENSDAMFTKENLNKLEAIYGPKYREALEDSLRAMKTGQNRGGTNSRLSNAALDYVNGSVGVIMFTNMRSALLQGISMVNFVNWDFNNPLKAGGAFLNLPQFAKDFSHIMNSKYLTDRRNGLKLNIHENEIANAAKTSKNKAAAIINLIIEKGYSPTKFMDSFAIAFGGATYYRNRIKDLMKKNPKLSIEEAQERAFEEMRDVSEKTQQSSDPSKISQQQRSDLGRLVLQFVNTPMQYARLQKRAVQDLANGRGNPKEHISKLIYYGFVQNLIFNGLQQALFAFGFEDDEKKVEAALPKKTRDIANGMLDSSLRGLGLAGVTVGVLKNLVLDVYDRSKKDRPEYQDAWMKLLQFSPAISSKIKRLKNAGWVFDSKDRRKMIKEEGFSIDNPAVEAGANVVSAATNLPTDRILKKLNNLRAIAKDETELWMDIALFLGWPEWQLTVPDTPEQKKAEKEAKKKKQSKPKAVYRKKGGYKPVVL